MVYASKKEYNQVHFIKKVLFKFGKIIIQYFPLNRARIFGLKMCGFQVGKYVYIGPDLIIASPISEKSCNLIIGDRVAIGPRVTIVLSSDANWSNLMQHIDFVKSTVTLGDDCWVGAGAIILPGVKIGKMAIVGAGAVVVKDVDDFTVVAGVPAKVIKRLNF